MGAEESVLQVTHLCNSYNKMFVSMADSTYFVKSSHLRAFIGSFQHFAEMLQTC